MAIPGNEIVCGTSLFLPSAAVPLLYNTGGETAWKDLFRDKEKAVGGRQENCVYKTLKI